MPHTHTIQGALIRVIKKKERKKKEKQEGMNLEVKGDPQEQGAWGKEGVVNVTKLATGN